MSILVGDIETNDLRPNIIWMVGVLDFLTDEFTAYTGDDVAEGIVRLAEAEVFIGHNIVGYDIPVMENLTDGLVKFDQSRLIDTLPLSRELMPHLPNHKLATYGEMFNFPKLPFKDFGRFSPEMIPYCEQDCRLSKRVFQHLDEIIQAARMAS